MTNDQAVTIYCSIDIDTIITVLRNEWMPAEVCSSKIEGRGSILLVAGGFDFRNVKRHMARTGCHRVSYQMQLVVVV